MFQLQLHNYNTHVVHPIQASELVFLVDNYNATSALGTLEFTDRMAKYAMTDKTCRISDTSPQYIKALDSSMKKQVSSLISISEASQYYS